MYFFPATVIPAAPAASDRSVRLAAGPAAAAVVVAGFPAAFGSPVPWAGAAGASLGPGASSRRDHQVQAGGETPAGP